MKNRRAIATLSAVELARESGIPLRLIVAYTKK
jgi:hypothetical protein